MKSCRSLPAVGRLRACRRRSSRRRARRPLRARGPFARGVQRVATCARSSATSTAPGEDTTADGQFGPATAASLRAFEQAEDRRANGVASRSDQRSRRAPARSRGAVAPGGDDRPTRTTHTPAPVEDATLSEAARRSRPPTRRRRSRRSSRPGNEIATQALQVRRRARPLERLRLRLLGLGRATRCTAPGCSTTPLDSSGLAALRRARPRRLGHRSTPTRGHAYMIVAGPALRHERAQARRLALDATRMRSPRGYVARHPESL